MKQEDLFVETMEDLRRRCDLRATEYDMVQVAGLVRRLTLDGRMLWVEANRLFRLTLTCTWSRALIRKGDAWVAMLWLDPVLFDLFVQLRVRPEDAEEFDQVRSGSMQQFLGTRVARSGEDHVTVQELVLYYATRAGGVHYDTRPADNPLLARLVESAEEELRLTLLAVGRVVHRTLEPLAAATLLRTRPHPYGVAVGVPPIE